MINTDSVPGQDFSADLGDEAQWSVVRAVMLADAADVGPVAEVLKPGHFTVAGLGDVYSVVMDFHAAGWDVQDSPRLCQKLTETGALAKIGGAAGIKKLQRSSAGPEWAFYYADRVRRTWDANRLKNLPKSVGVLESLLGRLERGESERVFEFPGALSGFECGPGMLTFVAAPPGLGKTAFSMQGVFTLAESDSTVRTVVANAETTIDNLLKREITRRTGVPSKAMQAADLTPRQLELVRAATAEIMPLLERRRVDFMEPPFDLDNLEKKASEGEPGLLLLDYLQRFAPVGDPRTGTNAVVTCLRSLAMSGWGVLALSATARQQGKTGATHDTSKLSLASFKESGEVEFNADYAYVLRDMGEVDEGNTKVRKVQMDCLKNRYGEKVSLDLVFDMPHMTFSSEPAAPAFDDLPNDIGTDPYDFETGSF